MIVPICLCLKHECPLCEGVVPGAWTVASLCFASVLVDGSGPCAGLAHFWANSLGQKAALLVQRDPSLLEAVILAISHRHFQF